MKTLKMYQFKFSINNGIMDTLESRIQFTNTQIYDYCSIIFTKNSCKHFSEMYDFYSTALFCKKLNECRSPSFDDTAGLQDDEG